MKSPSPVISVEQLSGCLLVKFHGIQVAASSHAMILNEANYPPVYYIPREDIDEKYFARTDHTSYCPYKGDANYFSLQVPGHEGANAVWTYENPKVSVAPIRDYVAFYPDQVKFEVIKRTSEAKKWRENRFPRRCCQRVVQFLSRSIFFVSRRQIIPTTRLTPVISTGYHSP